MPRGAKSPVLRVARTRSLAAAVPAINDPACPVRARERTRYTRPVTRTYVAVVVVEVVVLAALWLLSRYFAA